MTRVAIMQPTYLPWSGYFGLLNSVDVFILLDSVQFSRRSWQQRNQIKTVNGPQYLTVPVWTKGRRNQRILEVEFDCDSGFARSHKNSIEMSYKKSPYYEDYAANLFSLLEVPSGLLVDLTVGLIQHLKDSLGIGTLILRSSQLEGRGEKADLLASLCRQVDATEYISPPGSREYLDASDAFKKINVPVRYFQFIHPEYSQQFGDFLPYMSCVDMLFNCGPQSLPLIESGSDISE